MLNSNTYRFSTLIEQIEIMQLWPSLTVLLAKQPEPWLIDFYSLLQLEKGDGVLQCLIRLSNFILTPSSKLNYLVSSHEWHWLSGSSQSTLLLIGDIIEQLSSIKIAQQQKPDVCCDWEFEIIEQSLDNLILKRNAMCNR